MSSVLVTGGAGYVGSHTVMRLAAAGYDVVVYDDLSAGHAETVDAVAGAFPARSIRLVRGDIGNAAAVASALRSSGAAAVMHFAARLSVGGSVADPIGYYRHNVAGTVALLAAMVETGVRRFVFSSTAATFGEPIATPIDETHPQRPINAYGETKLAIERMLPHVEKAHGLRSVVLRYFNAAGADPSGLIGERHDPEEHLIPLALRAASGGASAHRVRRRLPDARRDVHSRLRSRHGSRRGAPGRARSARGLRPLGRLQSGQRAGDVGA